MKTGYACDVCHRTTLRGIIHRIGNSIVCNHCRNILVSSLGEEVDSTNHRNKISIRKSNDSDDSEFDFGYDGDSV